MNSKPYPVPNADTRPFWEACNRHELTYQHCRGCGRVQFYPRALCSACHAGDLEWRTSAGGGRIVTFTIVHRAPTPAFKEDLPYVLALVDIEEGFRMMLNVRHCDPERVSIGMPVRVIFEARGPENQLIPQAEPASDR